MDREITEITEIIEIIEITGRTRKIMFPRCPRHSTRRPTLRCKTAKANFPSQTQVSTRLRYVLIFSIRTAPKATSACMLTAKRNSESLQT